MQYLWDKFLFVVCSKWCCARSTALSSECILAYAWAQPEELSLPSFPQLTSCESSAYQPASFNAVSLCSFKLCYSSAASWVASIIVTSTWDGSPGFTHKTSLLSNCLRTALLTPYLYLHISSEAQWRWIWYNVRGTISHFAFDCNSMLVYKALTWPLVGSWKLLPWAHSLDEWIILFTRCVAALTCMSLGVLSTVPA